MSLTKSEFCLYLIAWQSYRLSEHFDIEHNLYKFSFQTTTNFTPRLFPTKRALEAYVDNDRKQACRALRSQQVMNEENGGDRQYYVMESDDILSEDVANRAISSTGRPLKFTQNDIANIVCQYFRLAKANEAEEDYHGLYHYTSDEDDDDDFNDDLFEQPDNDDDQGRKPNDNDQSQPSEGNDNPTGCDQPNNVARSGSAGYQTDFGQPKSPSTSILSPTPSGRISPTDTFTELAIMNSVIRQSIYVDPDEKLMSPPAKRPDLSSTPVNDLPGVSTQVVDKPAEQQHVSSHETKNVNIEMGPDNFVAPWRGVLSQLNFRRPFQRGNKRPGKLIRDPPLVKRARFATTPPKVVIIDNDLGWVHNRCCNVRVVLHRMVSNIRGTLKFEHGKWW